MLKYAEKKDTNEILSLFNICFPNEEEFVQYFFENFFEPKNTIICIEDRHIVGMAMELEYIISGIGSATYLYGVGTHPDYRGRGICGNILDFSHINDRKKDRAASILIPRNKGLFDFYRQYGYKTCFYVEESVIKCDSIPDGYIFAAPRGEELQSVYERSFSDRPHILRSAAYFDSQIRMFEKSDGGVLGVYDNDKLEGYCFYSVENGSIFFDEGMGELCEIAAKKIMSIKNFNEGIIRGVGKGKDFGMAYFYKNDCDDLYMNLMFN